MKRILLPLHLVVLCSLLAGCSSDKTPPSAAEAPKPQVATNSFWPDTRAVEASRIVGYDGKQMRKSLDKALDGGDAHNKVLEDAVKDAANSQ